MDMRREDGLHPAKRLCLCGPEGDSTGCPEHDGWRFHSARRCPGVITYQRGVWVAKLPYAAKDQLKSAGFRYHGLVTECRRQGCRGCAAQVLKAWWTDSATVVRQMPAALLDGTAARALKEHDRTVGASRALDAEIEVPAPEGLDYLPFQRGAIKYICRAPKPRRVLLGDDMGVGKSIETIGYLNLSRAETVLVVCPASLKINWQRELERWLVEPRQIWIVDSDREVPTDAEIVIVNYERLIRDAVLQQLMGWFWDVLICDEAHALKSPKAKRTQAVLGAGKRQKGLLHRCGTFLALTGTAMLNRPIELWTLLTALDPQGFPDKHQFGIRYCAGQQKRIGWDREKHEPKMAWDFSGASNLAELQDKMRGRCLVRRTKAEVLPELPPKRHELIVLDPARARAPLAAQQALWQARGGDRLVQALEGAWQRRDRAEWEAQVAELVAELEVAFGELSAERAKIAAAKVPLVVEHVRGVLEHHEVPKLVVFGHHHEALDKICDGLDVPQVRIDGRTALSARQEAVDRFQGDDSVRVMVAGIRAAGEGLTLTAANHVVFSELDWTPARNAQAEDRLHRIGQKNMVLVQQLVFDGSLDALVAKVLVHKMQVAEQVLG